MTDQIQIGGNDWRDQLIVELKRTGGDPSHLFELLESIIHQRAWEYLLDTNGRPVGSLRRLIEAPPPIGCGQKADKVLKLLEVEHRYERDNTEWHERMTVLRDEVRREMGIDIPALSENYSAVGRGKKSDMSDISQRGGNSRDYVIARLKRDAPDIAQRVIDGEISAAEGKRLASGQTEPKRRAINMDDPESAANTILEYMSRENIEDLIAILYQALQQP